MNLFGVLDEDALESISSFDPELGFDGLFGQFTFEDSESLSLFKQAFLPFIELPAVSEVGVVTRNRDGSHFCRICLEDFGCEELEDSSFKSLLAKFGILPSNTGKLPSGYSIAYLKEPICFREQCLVPTKCHFVHRLCLLDHLVGKLIQISGSISIDAEGRTIKRTSARVSPARTGKFFVIDKAKQKIRLRENNACPACVALGSASNTSITLDQPIDSYNSSDQTVRKVHSNLLLRSVLPSKLLPFLTGFEFLMPSGTSSSPLGTSSGTIKIRPCWRFQDLEIIAKEFSSGDIVDFDGYRTRFLCVVEYVEDFQKDVEYEKWEESMYEQKVISTFYNNFKRVAYTWNGFQLTRLRNDLSGYAILPYRILKRHGYARYIEYPIKSIARTLDNLPLDTWRFGEFYSPENSNVILLQSPNSKKGQSDLIDTPGQVLMPRSQLLWDALENEFQGEQDIESLKKLLSECSLDGTLEDLVDLAERFELKVESFSNSLKKGSSEKYISTCRSLLYTIATRTARIRLENGDLLEIQHLPKRTFTVGSPVDELFRFPEDICFQLYGVIPEVRNDVIECIVYPTYGKDNFGWQYYCSVTEIIKFPFLLELTSCQHLVVSPRETGRGHATKALFVHRQKSQPRSLKSLALEFIAKQVAEESVGKVRSTWNKSERMKWLRENTNIMKDVAESKFHREEDILQTEYDLLLYTTAAGIIDSWKCKRSRDELQLSFAKIDKETCADCDGQFSLGNAMLLLQFVLRYPDTNSVHISLSLSFPWRK